MDNREPARYPVDRVIVGAAGGMGKD